MALGLSAVGTPPPRRAARQGPAGPRHRAAAGHALATAGGGAHARAVGPRLRADRGPGSSVHGVPRRSPMIEPGLVSTIVPVHDRPAMLVDAVESVLAQSYRLLEILIVDDGATDDTPAVVDALAADHPEVRAIHIPNGGPGVAREAGRRQARGEFVQYLDSDDVLLSSKFQSQVRALSADPECGVCYGMTRCIDEAGEGADRACRRTGERIEHMFPSFLVDRWWGTSTPLYRRSVTDAVGPWAVLGRPLAYVSEFVSEQREHAADRLSRHGSSDPAKLCDRAAAHALILGHAERAGIGPQQEEMRHFARELFLLSRQCGAAGLCF